MEVIVPAAGLSTRFPGHRPKYLLYDFKHTLMFRNAVEQFIDKYKITIGILREHAEKYNAIEHIQGAVPGCDIVLMDPTTGPADTVYQILKNIPGNFPFLVKDCDSFFEHNVIEDTNYVCVSNIREHEVLKKLYSKSFVKYNEQGIIVDIVEKQVVSDTFCVGGYKFNSSDAYRRSFETLSQSGEVYVSHVIQHLLSQGEIFVNNKVHEYIDVGTAADWQEYNDKPVIFCDIDGTLIKAQSRYGNYNYGSEPIILEENYKKIKRLHDSGAQIIFTTAREDKYHDITCQMLFNLGFGDCLVLTGLHNASRILINDYNDANPYPRAVAYNIKRDHDNLKDIMK